MNKNQALAAMDARMVRVTAERQRWTERRQRFMLRLYPTLKNVAPDTRVRLFQEARRYAFKHWTVYAALGVLIATAVYLLWKPISDGTSEVPNSTVVLLMILALLPAFTPYLHIRGYLRLLVGVQSQSIQERSVDRDA